jgi:hypothetical protein
VPRRIRWPKAPDRIAGGSEPERTPAAGRGVKTALELWVTGGRAHEVPYLKAALMQRINAYFGYRAITDIIAVDGPIAEAWPPKPRRLPTAAEREAMRKAAALAEDDPLAEALARLGANIARRTSTGR